MRLVGLISPKRLAIGVTASALAVGMLLAPAAMAAPAEITAPVVSAAADQDVAARYTVTVRCDLVKHGGHTVGKVEGTGSGKTRPAAVAAAKKDADRKVPRGHYKRHCKVIKG
ncbi:hypothetical protein [Streptoalloteichus hindustanus]|uniref:Uncharacterized protein n=1 Tax=Streptoalloteichus hindustanus TaxID=2017 RepID=A0A1M5CTZ4_STRHI|nr:hypothetical protein [Streptoalloteichus hindustanus]SHF58195.1 hypothetical protein SAMN05444320_104167 [Streptoalloteichus hindustanus]